MIFPMGTVVSTQASDGVTQKSQLHIALISIKKILLNLKGKRPIPGFGFLIITVAGHLRISTRDRLRVPSGLFGRSLQTLLS